MNLIKVVTDKEVFGEKCLKPLDNPMIRYAARGIVENDNDEIAVFCKRKMNEYKLPGGGMDEGEKPIETFRREVAEETGCQIKNIHQMGCTMEEKHKTNFKQLSYVFDCKLKTLGTPHVT